jgi:GAF domain-containing protein
VVGPYQGPLACQLLRGSGVCITAVNQKQSVVVPDVHQFEGHIACDSRSNSEIVVPVFDQFKQIKAVLDIDSISFNSFTQTDRQYLELIADMVYVNKE